MLARRSCLVTTALVAVALAVGSPAQADSTYLVRPGDTLSGIAAAHRTTVASLARVNLIDPKGLLLAGARLTVPSNSHPADPAARYRVRLGDTLTGIADRYGTSVAALARLNRLDPNGLLISGRTLLVPGGAEAAVPAVVAPPSKVLDTRTEIRASVRAWADHYGVSRSLALAVAWMESGDQPNLTSAAGAWGVMQVMPVTWLYTEVFLIGSPVPHTTDGGIRVGMAYLHHLLRSFGGDRRLAVAAYLQGEGSVLRQGVLPSSLSYVNGILTLAGAA
jgi:LysM repeat protein